MDYPSGFNKGAKGFTLIELSIVLVIIGLIIGGVLVGRDLISAAVVRSQITQIEKYQSAVNTFKSKYGGLPGDLRDPAATQYGFSARGQYAGEGDGSGIIEGVFMDGADGMNFGNIVSGGETAIFWKDLETAHLIEAGGFNGSETADPASILCDGGACSIYYPKAKIGGFADLVVMSDSGINYFFLNWARVIGANGNKINPALNTWQAYKIDAKIDDGLPQSGRIMALREPGDWAIGPDYHNGGDAPGSQTQGTPDTCYDNNNVLAAVELYSIEQNNGTGLNCSLSFQFQ